MSVPTSIRVPEDDDARLRSLAGRTGRSKAWYITTAIRRYLDDMEAAEIVAAEYLEHVAAGDPGVAIEDIIAARTNPARQAELDLLADAG